MDLRLVIAASVLLLNTFGAALVLHDKLAALNNRRRIPEATFFALAFLLAWPGMVLTMRRARHKTRKRSFQVRFGAAAVLGTPFWIGAFLLWP